MFLSLTGLQKIVVVGFTFVGGLIVGLVGLSIGVDYGGDFCDVCEFNGLTGYEATGQLGFLMGTPIGFVVGALSSCMFFTRRRVRRGTTTERPPNDLK